MFWTVLAFVAAAGSLVDCQCNRDVPTGVGTCVSIQGTICDSYYQYSMFPNSISDDLNASRQSLDSYFKQLGGVIETCSLRVYLCLAFMPPCDPSEVQAVGRGPCQSFCDEVKSGCGSLRNFLTADVQFNCLFADCTRYSTENCLNNNDSLTLAMRRMDSTESPEPNISAPLSCPLPNSTFFTDSSKSFSLGWTNFWSVLCYVSTLLTLLTFLLDTSRFEYPWRPIVYLALMFNVHSIAYFFSAALGHGLVTCPNNVFVESGSSWTWAHTPCLLIFTALYYSMMAAFLWWVVLATGWFLASAWQWSHEAVNKVAPLFHIVCWVLPLLMTIALLAARVIGADELTGVCFLVRDGSTSSFYGMLIGLLIPLLLLLTTGIVLLVLGFLGVLKVRAHMRSGGKQEEQQILEKLMIRIGVFVAIYIVPAAIMIGCFFYELVSRPSWHPLSENCSSCTRANSAVFMVRVLMFLLIGVLTGTWIWSRKTLHSWARLLQRCTQCHAPTKEVAELPTVPSANNVMSHVPTNNYSYADSGLDSL